MLYVGNTEFRGRAISSQEISILLFLEMNRHALTIPHTNTHIDTLTSACTDTHGLRLRATLSGRPVLAVVVALHSTAEFTTTTLLYSGRLLLYSALKHRSTLSQSVFIS